MEMFFVTAALLAIDPAGLKGAVLRGLPGAMREEWLLALRQLIPASTAWRRVPLGIPDSRLLGGLDLAASLKAGRPVSEAGVLAESHGGFLVLPMAERLEAQMVARIGAVLDHEELRVERDGLKLAMPLQVAILALDEGLEPEEKLPEALADRLAFHLYCDPTIIRLKAPAMPDPREITAARARLAKIIVADDVLRGFCAAALALGIESLRAPLLAVRCARAIAALNAHAEVTRDDAALAARLILAPRARQIPQTESPEAAPEEAQQQPEQEADTPARQQETTLEDVILAAAQAALPADILAGLGEAARDKARQMTAAGRAGVLRRSAMRGRPTGSRPAALRAGVRLALVETLRAAAPWQQIRRRERPQHAPLVHVRREDIRVRRYKQRSETTTIFLVDASGSAALHRLAEAKGAVELLLADCYVRRDRVAVIAFRGRGAEVLLEPTHSLVRAKRSLAALPGGGGTPLASGLDAGLVLAEAARRRGQMPVLVTLTDGRANVARDGTGGRSVAEAEALTAARQMKLSGFSSLLIDTAPRAQAFARSLAEAMGARYVPLPFADASRMSAAVRQAAEQQGPGR